MDATEIPQFSLPEPKIGDPCIVCGDPIREEIIQAHAGEPMTWSGACCPECSQGRVAIEQITNWLLHIGHADLAHRVVAGEWRP